MITTQGTEHLSMMIIVPILMIINFQNSRNATFDQDYYDHDPDDNRWSKLRECNTRASQRRELRQPTENPAGHQQLRFFFRDDFDCSHCHMHHHGHCLTKTLPKAQRTRGLSSTYQINFFGSYHKFKHKSWSNIFRISILHQVQNLNQTSPFWQNLNLKSWPNQTRISTKNELHSHNQASAAK